MRYTFTYKRSRRSKVYSGTVRALDLANATAIAQMWVDRTFGGMGVFVSIEPAS